MRKSLSLLAPLALGLLSAAYGAGAAQPGTVRGVALDSHGHPLKGALVWIMPSVAQGWVAPGVSNGVLQLHTDAKGQYVSPTLPDQPYNVYAWQRVKYAGQTFCVPLAAEKEDGDDAFSARAGAVRNFRWQLTGEMQGQSHDNAYFGAEVRLMNGSWDGTSPMTRDSVVELTLTPDGPLIDGSAGKPLVRKVNFYDGFVYDLPVGHYRVAAAELGPGGTRTPLVLNGGSGAERFQGTLDFQAEGGPCGGYGGSNGVERAFIDLARVGE
ncbi:carboxypeptidase-like regulatory domain-containing protein [Deinococcus ruber]|uniref:Carboxypeptidase regulatory-like domain-containing protein n=1 Tax=Deinococcus ruber TaxID=1848197 RepID=A0A918CFZ4_9DEIO|nr:carboxypeptidase-like regulatory domain-containing protein [Deinococcus ruber]GGR19405.1 hypothetical protein GCM10008957_34890 [Deinococcus ruber]